MAGGYGTFDEKKLLEYYKTLVKKEYNKDLSNQDLKKYKSLRKSIMTFFEIPNFHEYFGTPCSLLKISKSLFENHSKLETINFVLPTKMEEIEDKVFKDCKKLKNIILPNTLKIIGESAFENCESLEHLKIPKAVKKIGVNAFAGCTSLKEFVIPKTVKDIGHNAFKGIPLVYYNGSADGAPWGALKIINEDIKLEDEIIEEEAKKKAEEEAKKKAEEEAKKKAEEEAKKKAEEEA